MSVLHPAMNASQRLGVWAVDFELGTLVAGLKKAGLREGFLLGICLWKLPMKH